LATAGFQSGVFDSIVGYESVEGPSNPNYTRSTVISGAPNHTGILMSYRVNDAISLSGGIANTKGRCTNAREFGEDGKAESTQDLTWLAGAYRSDSWGFLSGSSFYPAWSAARRQRGRTRLRRKQHQLLRGATIATPVTD